MSLIERYNILMYSHTPFEVEIIKSSEAVMSYQVKRYAIGPATTALLDSIKEELIKDVNIRSIETFKERTIELLKKELERKSRLILEERIPQLDEKVKNILICTLVCDMVGLGDVEIFLNDPNLEEVAINTSNDPVWVYHKKYGWLITNVVLDTEQQIENYANIIARRVGRQISNLEPLLDAHLVSGDRANATLSPISSKGNTITIRKFRREPWTIIDFIKNETLNSEVAAFLWLCIECEMNMIVAGGTSSGKTSMLNALMFFVQPNHRIISIEQTRELQMPSYLHWVPLTVRLPNPEGKGGITMLNLMVNALRMRPDRIVVGEIRTQREAEVLFEAMHTGHSVYATLHADTTSQLIRRMTGPPINVPAPMMEALQLVVIQHRDRRRGIRKTYQVAEIMPATERPGESTLKMNTLYRLKPDGKISAHEGSIRIFDELNMHTGMSDNEILDELKEKVRILEYMVKNNINRSEDVGRLISQYYSDRKSVLKLLRSKKQPEK